MSKVTAHDARQADNLRAKILAMTGMDGWDLVADEITSFIERERERIESLTLDDRENLIARSRLSALKDVADIPGDLVRQADRTINAFEAKEIAEVLAD
tara:strand:+ start:991 stop:1287 length:297 start_codon:yes stop_codon:yes gene_type:complete